MAAICRCIASARSNGTPYLRDSICGVVSVACTGASGSSSKARHTTSTSAPGFFPRKSASADSRWRLPIQQ